MIDRKKVIKTAIFCINCGAGDHDCLGCPAQGDLDCIHSLLDDLSEMLKEEEPVEPVKTDSCGLQVWACGCCNNIVGTGLFRGLHCSYCGRKVKWND